MGLATRKQAKWEGGLENPDEQKRHDPKEKIKITSYSFVTLTPVEHKGLMGIIFWKK